jgi:hypothetical protein
LVAADAGKVAASNSNITAESAIPVLMSIVVSLADVDF